MKRTIVPIVAILLSLAGCSFSKPIPESARFAIEDAAEFELFSLDPYPDQRADQKKNFRRWAVLGSTTIKDPETRDRLIQEFKAAVAEHRGGPKRGFVPRHGIKAVHEGSTHEFVIAFESSQVRWYIDGQASQGFLISDSPAASFDDILRAANVRIAEVVNEE